MNIKFDDKISKALLEAAHGDNSPSGQSSFQVSAKQIQSVVPFVEVGAGKNEKAGKQSILVDQEIEMSGKSTINPDSHLSSVKGEGTEECKTVDIEMNGMGQLLPDSPSSLGDAKGSDNDSFYQGSERVRV